MRKKSKSPSELTPLVHRFLEASNAEQIVHVTNDIANHKLTAFSHLFVYPECRDMTLGDAAEWNKSKFVENASSCPPLALIDVVLSINREYRTKVEPVMIALRAARETGDSALSFLRENTFEALENDIKTQLPSFYRAYSENGEKHDFDETEKQTIRNHFKFIEVNDKKMRILLDMLNAIRRLRADAPTSTDYDVMHRWAVEHCSQNMYDKNNGSVDVKKLAESLGGKIKNVADATIQHLRMHFGAEVFKPDQRVKEVLIHKFLEVTLDSKLFNAGLLFNRQAHLMMEKIKKATGKPLTYLDSIFVNYGSGYYARKDQEIGYTKLLLQMVVKRLLERNVPLQDLAYATGLTESKVLELASES